MSYLSDLVAIRDAYAAELKAELARRAALVAAGHPPPTDASLNGKTVSWNVYQRTMMDLIKSSNELVITAGGEGIPEEWVRAYT